MPIMQLATITNPPTAAQWNTAELANAKTLGLPTTSWQVGQPERTTFATVALVAYDMGIGNALIAQGGFLSFAASGFVNYVAADGTAETIFVTPDPSIPAQNPTGALGWLDVLADGQYDVQRILSSKAGGVLAFVNTQATTYGPFALDADGVGTYHAAQATGEAYSNTASFSIPQSAVVDVVTGVAASGSLIEVTTGAAPSTGDIVALAGVLGVPPLAGTTAWQVTQTSGTTFTLDGSTFSGSYISGGTIYTPTLAPFTCDTAGSQGDADPETVNVPVTSLIGVTCANYGTWTGTDIQSNIELAIDCKLKLGALSVGGVDAAILYYVRRAQQLAPLLTPPDALTAAMTRALVLLDTTTGTVNVTVANAAGSPSSDDVDATQAVLVAYMGITGFTIATQAAAEHSVAVALTVFLPAAFNTAATSTLFVNAVAAYFRALAVGGVTLTGGTSPDTNVVPYDSVLGVVYVSAALNGIPLAKGDVQGTIESGVVNVQLDLTPIPEVAVPSIAVALVSN